MTNKQTPKTYRVLVYLKTGNVYLHEAGTPVPSSMVGWVDLGNDWPDMTEGNATVACRAWRQGWTDARKP